MMLGNAPYTIILTIEGKKCPELFSAAEYECDGGHLIFYGTEVCKERARIDIDLAKRTAEVEVTYVKDGELMYAETYLLESYEIRFDANLLGMDRGLNRWEKEKTEVKKGK